MSNYQPTYFLKSKKHEIYLQNLPKISHLNCLINSELCFYSFFFFQQYNLLKPFGDCVLRVCHCFMSEVLEAVQDGLSLPDSKRVHLSYLGSQTLIQVQDLILSEKCFCYHSSATSIASQTLFESHSRDAKDDHAFSSQTLSSSVLYHRSVRSGCHKRCVCVSVFVAHWGLGIH